MRSPRYGLYIDGIASLFKKYNLQGCEEPYAKLKAELDRVRRLDRRRPPCEKLAADFRQPPELYALNLENFGIDVPPAELAAMAHKAFNEYQAEMQTFAAQIAKQRRVPQERLSRRHQAAEAGSACRRQHPSLLPRRLKAIEGIIVNQSCQLARVPARIRIGSPAREQRRT